jgi:hypothetical protein
MNIPGAYHPQPIDASKITLSREILELTELLARNAHEVWALQRQADGWQYGTQRSDERKLHPCLVPYEDLPESEKIYDRKASIETLKGVIAMGYRIQKRKNIGA